MSRKNSLIFLTGLSLAIGIFKYKDSVHQGLYSRVRDSADFNGDLIVSKEEARKVFRDVYLGELPSRLRNSYELKDLNSKEMKAYLASTFIRER